MRELTGKQKKVLDECFKLYEPKDWSELQDDDIRVLEAINDTEILWQETNRYLGDLYWGK